MTKAVPTVVRKKDQQPVADVPKPAAKATTKTKKSGKNYLEIAIKSINKAMNSDIAATVLSDQETNPVLGWVKTRIWALDYLISDFRGIPIGRPMTVWGPEATGKSSLFHYLMRIFQDSDFTQVYFDYDDAVDREMVERSGIDLSRIVFPTCGSLEEGFDALKAITDSFYGKRTGAKKLKRKELIDSQKDAPKLATLWDSLWASAPKALLEAKSAEQRLIGVEAAAYSTQFKRMRQFMRGRPMVLLFTNEAREDIGGYSPWGPQTKQPGGRAVRHYMTTVLKLGRAGMEKRTVNGRDRTIGMWVQVTAQKARFGVMGRKSKFFLSFSKSAGGPDPVESNFAFLKDMNFLKAGKDKTFGIKGLSDIPFFSKKEWPDVMKKYERKIVHMLREELCADKVVDVDDSPEDEV